jgi:outer membrane biogenesis lipoprotein LolB
MRVFLHVIATGVLFVASLLLSACSTAGVQDARASGLENRQDRMDSRTAARQERWKVRGEREDARAAARFDSW